MFIKRETVWRYKDTSIEHVSYFRIVVVRKYSHKNASMRYPQFTDYCLERAQGKDAMGRLVWYRVEAEDYANMLKGCLAILSEEYKDPKMYEIVEEE